MSNWKKIIVSGSAAHLSSVTASNGAIISGSLNVSGNSTFSGIDTLILTGSGYVTGSWSVNGYSDVTGSLRMSGSITNVNNIDFNMTSSAANAAGRFVWDDGNGSLDLGLKGGNVNLLLGQQTYARVHNSEATTLNKGEVVYISGSQGNRVAAKRADYSGEQGSATTIGIVAESIASGGEGFIITNGVLEKLNTVGLTEGKLLYLSSSGQYSETKPIAPQHTVTLGYVERVHATVGSIYVKIDNGYELNELHNVLTNGATYGDLLFYSASLWTHTKQLSGSYGVTGSLQATSFTGSLQGSASYAIQSLSASFATNASTASFVLNAVSSSFAENSSTASFVLNAVSSSFATTASYVLGGGGISDGDKGDITVSSGGSTWTIDNDVVTFAKMQNISPGVLGRQSAGSGDITTLTALTDYHVLQWISGAPFWSTITTNNIQISNDNRILGKGTGLASELSLGNGLAISGTTLFVTSSAFTGSLQGTASYATQALSSSFATNSSTASYVLNAVSASFATNASTSSYVLNAVSASFATTASYVLGGGGASVTNPGNNYIITSDGTVGGLVGETNLLFDGSTLNVTGSAIISATTRLTDIEERELTVTIGGTPSSLSLDLSQANVFEVTYNNNVNSFSITNPPPTNYAGSFTLVTTGTGIPYPWNWGSAVTWSGGSAPSVTSTNGKRDIYGFITTNQGTNWYGFIGGQNL